ncbi:MAG: APC family permease [Clostridiales bacterium]
MTEKLQKRYGLLTAVTMVVGIVIGSGVFFKAEKILNATNGSLSIGILAWMVGGAIMLSCSYVFSLLAARYVKVNGIVDYAEAALGKTYGYLVGWFMAVIYYPILVMVLAWLSARYTAVFFGFTDPIASAPVYIIALIYMIIAFAINAIAPIISGKIQVTTTVIKLIPLALIAVFGVVYGLFTGQTVENFSAVTTNIVTNSNPFLTSVVATAFAYEGWIIATSINAELKDSKKNLPRALVLGSLIVIFVYIAYFIGLAGAMPTSEFMAGGEGAVKIAFTKLLGNFGGSTLFIFVVISCLGTLNGLTLGNTRGIYAIATRGMGPKPKLFAQLDRESNMPVNSAIFGVVMSSIWLLVWYGNFAEWWPLFFDISELPIVTMYGFYIPIFIWMMRSLKTLTVFQRIIMPLVALAGSVFMIYAAYLSHGIAVWIYLGMFALILLLGLALKGKSA